MDDRDTWRAANILIQKYGPDAALHASQRADEPLERGDIDGRRLWQQIHAAAHERLRDMPRDGEAVQ